MSTITKPYTFSSGATIIAAEHNSNFDTVYNDYNGNISNINIASNAAIAYSKLNLSGGIQSTDVNASTVFSTSNLGSGTASTGSVLLGSGAWGYIPYLKYTNTQTSGTAGGASTALAWHNIPLNTEDFDTSSIGSISSNQITLPAGTYRVSGNQPFYRTNGSQTRLYNVTDSSLILTGQVVNAADTGNVNGISSLVGQFVLSGSKAIAFQYYTSTNTSTSDLGVPLSVGSEVYAQIELWKIS